VDDTNIDAIDISAYFEDDDTALDFDISDFDMVDLGEEPTRYVKVKFNSRPILVRYSHAAELAKAIKLFPGEQLHCIVPGNFIFGDFIEALLVEKEAICEEMHIATLSMSQNNIDSLANLLDTGFVGKLTLIISNYFYSHERKDLMPYLLERLDVDNRLECMVLRNHTKIALMAVGELRLVLSGSGNLRSSQNVEQFVLQESQELYDFYFGWFAENRNHSIIRREDYGEYESRGKA